MGKREGKSSKRSKPEVEEETNAADEARSQPAIAEEPPAKQPKTEHGGQDDKSSSVSAASEPNPAAEQSDEVGKMSSKALPADLSGVVANVPRMKTSLCSYFRKGNCRHGDLCRYAHGEAELKPRPDGSWDPTSDFAKSLARDALPVPAAVKLVAPISVAEEAAEDDSSEITIKKCITPVQPRWSNDDLKKFLTDMNISFVTAKKRRGDRTAFVGFQDEDQVASAIKIFDSIKEGGRKMQVKDVLPRTWERNAENVSAVDDVMADADNDEGMEAAKPGVTIRVKNICDAVTPLGHLTYEEQLNIKREDVTQVLKRLARNTRKGLPAGVLMPDWMIAARDNGGLPCALEGVLSSPVVDGYRNKCEFSIGCAVDGTRAVGFQLGSFREGILAVAEPTDCRNVSSIARSYAAVFQKFVQISDLPVWNKTNNKGFWRMLTVREGRGSLEKNAGEQPSVSEVMLLVQVCPTGIDEETRNVEYKKMVDHLSLASSAASPPLPLTALIVQDHTGVSNAAPANAPLHALTIPGEHPKAQAPVNYIHDHISNLKFRISPTAFFQVNTLAAERLYSLAGDWAELTPDTLLFDVCCGTGTIGLTLAHRVGMVVGIEMNQSAVADAKQNAEINNITNCRFVASKAEDVMESLLREYITSEGEEENSENEAESVEKKGDKKRFKNIVAIVDPPRVGLHPVVLKTLRLHTQLRRLVYISCNPQSLLANAVELCTPLSRENSTEKGSGRGNWRGLSNVGLARNRIKKMPPSTPFNPKKAMAVDLFPHTSHCEMVMLFER
ncbi:tRNA (uracil-5-)-methyltransferase [Marchantia polymorpha subsp. ruderalis]|uniref:C3H1-type domain-containing protein n=2 Tax=Marchantia polymorpha TaxID=3197 RepID=A0A176WS34_MARPO|nr:hypothetical protein AXG93_1278s1110 [Marchantia polymorpha subsp. ruderalis]PTQ34589.1 hypothetical protein MARPO_0078s0012 [Marchantia polymorpha]BBN09995.1 hypothetical protein Mp_5g00110 [Marchantia polymorpha subsp. ruderalis]|eukprot:PTQ34589.1 hypothetical protein MARPO_0078s0012 [Marchantia polymorpha]